MLTKENFIAIAEIINNKNGQELDAGYRDMLLELAGDMSDYFEAQNELFNRALFLRACGDMNQCGGCCCGQPIVDGNHVNKHGRAVIGCTKDRYGEVTDEQII